MASYFSRSELVWLLYVLCVRLCFQKVQDMLRRRGQNFRTLPQIRETELKVTSALNSWSLRCSMLQCLHEISHAQGCNMKYFNHRKKSLGFSLYILLQFVKISVQHNTPSSPLVTLPLCSQDVSYVKCVILLPSNK